MKKNLWLIFCGMISLSLAAQTASNPAAATPSTGTNSTTNATATSPTNSVTKSAKKKSARKSPKAVAKKKEPELRTVPLVAGNATVVASNVNVRGQAKLKSEVITRLNKGQEVAVLEEVTLKKSGPDEPSAWARIILPARTAVWVNAQFI